MAWEPSEEIGAQQLAEVSAAVLALPDLPYEARDEELRIDCAGMAWDVAGRVYEPTESKILRGADGKKVGAFLLHGGGGDHRGMDNLGSLLAEKFGIKALALTYPGHWNFDTADHEWPGEPIDDGTGHPRLAIWDRSNRIGYDEYDLIKYDQEPQLRAHRGTSFLLAAKPGTQFWRRQAAWPLAYETAYKTACARAFPEDEYSLYLHGHSTGGPQVHMLLQRIGNVAGLIGMETSSFGSFKKHMDAPNSGGENFPFNYMTLRSWRDTARYMGVEAGIEGVRHLPLLIEQVFESWERGKGRPGFKSEHFIQFAGIDALTAAANALADDLGLDTTKRSALVDRYVSYTAPLCGADAPPLPPLLYIINEGSRDHRLDNYRGVLFPRLSELDPPPKKTLVYFRGGIHNYNKPTESLPRGVAVVGAKVWYDAITHGYYLP